MAKEAIARSGIDGRQIENVVFGHYLLKYRLLQMGFSWTEIDNLHTKELDIMIHLYTLFMFK